MIKATININGCHDYNEFEMELTEEELKLVEKISKLSKEHSNMDCQPTLVVYDREE